MQAYAEWFNGNKNHLIGNYDYKMEIICWNMSNADVSTEMQIRAAFSIPYHFVVSANSRN